jgi:hypothetical protein
MIVYHGSNMIVDKPDVSHAFRDLDFGSGFYVTTGYDQIAFITQKAINQVLEFQRASEASNE